MSFYFDAYEHRFPEPPTPYHAGRELLWQFLATLALCFGAWYLWWRWNNSLNFDALWFSIPLVIAETCAYIGLILFIVNLWSTDDPPIRQPPKNRKDCHFSTASEDPISIDIFFTTYDEEVDLVRLGIRDAKAIRYPYPIDIIIHILDDGRRPAMADMAEAEGVNYITRSKNTGFKAGNLRNAMEQTSGDLILICDADTRLLPTFLTRTLGYFRDPKMAWVQTPHWFYDLPEITPPVVDMANKISPSLGRLAFSIRRFCTGEDTAKDPFNNDPRVFFDMILRRRNGSNSAFCCGASSIHRREAVMEAALRKYSNVLSGDSEVDEASIARLTGEKALDPLLVREMARVSSLETELTPYKFHVSEDIFTSITLHGDRERGWKSIQHPWGESRMLSPQDLLSWTIQRFKYAAGSLDIFMNDNPVFRIGGLDFRQKLGYLATFWSYLGGLWNIVFLMAPIIFLMFNISPVDSFSTDFFIRLIPFLILTELAMIVGTWNLDGYPARTFYIAFFPLNFKSLMYVLQKRQIKFHVTPKVRLSGNFMKLVTPQIIVCVLTIAAMAMALLAHLTEFRTYDLNALVANFFWGAVNIIALSSMIFAAAYQAPEND